MGIKYRYLLNKHFHPKSSLTESANWKKIVIETGLRTTTPLDDEYFRCHSFPKLLGQVSHLKIVTSAKWALLLEGCFISVGILNLFY
jgi:hypothetical protein